MNLTDALNIEDLRVLARATLPRVAYDFLERGAEDEVSMRENRSGFEALVVTTDVNVGGNREYNRRNGFGIPFRLNMPNMVDGALHSRWLAGVFLRTLLKSGVPRVSERRYQCRRGG